MSACTTSRFRVRFAPVPVSKLRGKSDVVPLPCASNTIPSKPDQHQDDRKRDRSRLGCRPCKKRRVKCDETFPVCLKCQRRGEFCEAPSRTRHAWQPETPWLLESARALQYAESGSRPDVKLLQYWLERASQIMALDPDINPMSFPILKHFDRCTSLVHALQSVGAAHQHFFDPKKMKRCLEERTLAMELVRKELDAPAKDLSVVFLTVFLLGLLSFWTAPLQQDADALYQAQAHFLGGRALVDDMLALPPAELSQDILFAIGSYLYWDMACSFIIDSDKQKPLNTEAVFTAVQTLHNTYHPILGYSTEITYLLANLGRYCRSVVDTGERDRALEETFAEQLEQWEPNRDTPELSALGDAYRSHGLINLYAICRRPATEETTAEESECTRNVDSWDLDLLYAPFEPDSRYWLDDLAMPTVSSQFVQALAGEGHDSNSAGPDCYCDTLESRKDWDNAIHDLALETVSSLMRVPDTHPCINLHGIPLLTAGSELTAEDVEEREFVTKRFRAVYSLNHLPANLAALELLEEIWKQRDAGSVVSWLELMKEKGWQVMLG